MTKQPQRLSPEREQDLRRQTPGKTLWEVPPEVWAELDAVREKLAAANERVQVLEAERDAVYRAISRLARASGYMANHRMDR